MTDDLVAFLRARLDEDEQVARAAVAGPWFASPGRHADAAEYIIDSCPGAAGDIVSQSYGEGGVLGMANANHIARHNPARVLAEVDAKRRFINEYAENREAADAEQCPNEWNGGIDMLGSFVLPVLALPYRNHPDYRSEWAPGRT